MARSDRAPRLTGRLYSSCRIGFARRRSLLHTHIYIYISIWSRCMWIYVGYPASSRRRTAIPSALRASRPFIDTKRTVSLSSRATVPACLICHSGRVCPKARGAGLNSKVCETGQTSSRSCPLDKVKSSPEWGVE